MEIVAIKSKFLRNIFDQNTYVLKNKKEAVIIDAGAELEDLVESTKGCKVLGVLLTHIHFDHVWNLEKILEHFDTCVYVVSGEEKRFADFDLNASKMIRQEMLFEIPQTKIKYYAEKFKLGSFEFEIFNTPGHTDDSVCILMEDCLFTGDTIFDGAIGRTDLDDGDDNKQFQSLEKIRDIDFKMAYPGHYEPCTKDKIVSTTMFYI